MTLNPKNLQDAHWDYAHTVTGYGVQGASKTYAIDYEVSYRKNLSNQRSFYIGASRAVQHLTIYTNKKDALLAKILGNSGNKYAALEVTGKLKSEKNPLQNNPKDPKNDKASNTIFLQKGTGKDKQSFVVEDLKTAIALKKFTQNNDILAVLKRENLVKIETQNLGQKVVFCLNNGVAKAQSNLIHDAAKRLIDAGKEVYIAAFDPKTSIKGNSFSAQEIGLRGMILYKNWQDFAKNNTENLQKIASTLNKSEQHSLQKVGQKTEEVELKNTVSKLNSQQKSPSVSKVNSQKTQEQNTQQMQKTLMKTEKELY